MTRQIDISPPRPCQTYSKHSLERLLAEDLPAAEAGALQKHLESCSSCSQLFADLKAERQAFFARMPYARFVEDHAQRKMKTGLQGRVQSWSVVSRLQDFLAALRSPKGLGALTSLAAVAILLLWIAPASDLHSTKTRRKGGPDSYLAFLVKEADGARRGQDGESLRPGDRIQFLLRMAPGRRSMVLLGIDGRGEVSIYHSEAIREHSKGNNRLRPMAHSLILDDTIGTERFYLIFSSDIDPLRLAKKARAAALKLSQSGADLRKAPLLEMDVPDLLVDSLAIHKIVPRKLGLPGAAQ